MESIKEIRPYSELSSDKKEQVTIMFDRIARRYDLLNHLLSFNTDRCWRKKLVRLPGIRKAEKILDVAAGTGDLSLLAAEMLKARIVATDISEGMLRIATSKIQRKGYQDRIRCVIADAEKLPFDADAFDAVMVAFGVRNFGNPSKGLSEMFRVVRPGGTVAILEFSVPRMPLFRHLYLFYFRRVVPFIGRLVSGDSDAYRYLNRSAEAFPQGEHFCRMLRGAGFAVADSFPVTLGVARIYTGVKPGHVKIG